MKKTEKGKKMAENDTKMSESKTTIQISKATMLEIKKRAIEEEISYTAYLEKLVRTAWSKKHGRDSN